MLGYISMTFVNKNFVLWMVITTLALYLTWQCHIFFLLSLNMIESPSLFCSSNGLGVGRDFISPRLDLHMLTSPCHFLNISDTNTCFLLFIWWNFYDLWSQPRFTLVQRQGVMHLKFCHLFQGLRQHELLYEKAW